jgi:hypothetical protein
MPEIVRVAVYDGEAVPCVGFVPEYHGDIAARS